MITSIAKSRWTLSKIIYHTHLMGRENKKNDLKRFINSQVIDASYHLSNRSIQKKEKALEKLQFSNMEDPNTKNLLITLLFFMVIMGFDTAYAEILKLFTSSIRVYIGVSLIGSLYMS